MKKLIALAATLFLLSCSNDGNNANKTSGDESVDTASASVSNAGGSDISVSITGGPNEGIYHVITKDPTCSEGLTGENSFGNQYSEINKADNELSSVQLIIDDKNAAKKGTDKFSISVGFGKISGGKKYDINTRDNNSGLKKEGSGKATLTESGNTKTVVIEGKTADGVGISATLVCNKIMTANGIQ
jgi:hypothetical protein